MGAERTFQSMTADGDGSVTTGREGGGGVAWCEQLTTEAAWSTRSSCSCQTTSIRASYPLQVLHTYGVQNLILACQYDTSSLIARLFRAVDLWCGARLSKEHGSL